MTEDLSTLFQKFFYKMYSGSDHDFLYVMKDFSGLERVPGIWVVNAELLKNDFSYFNGNRKLNY